jgi:hypothetical protein
LNELLIALKGEYKERAIKKKTYINGFNHSVFFVLRGCIDKINKDQIINTYNYGFVNLEELHGDNNNCYYACDDSNVLFIDKKSLINNTEITNDLINIISLECKYLQNKLIDERTLDCYQIVKNYLISLDKEIVSISISRLAKITGFTRERVSVIMSQLNENGIIIKNKPSSFKFKINRIII